jgi:hypothetical protein
LGGVFSSQTINQEEHIMENQIVKGIENKIIEEMTEKKILKILDYNLDFGSVSFSISFSHN